MQKNYSKGEICELINAKYPNLNTSPDIIRLDINTLKSAGFDIEIGHKGNHYKYVLNWNPLNIKFTKSEIDIINQTKKSSQNKMVFQKHLSQIYHKEIHVKQLKKIFCGAIIYIVRKGVDRADEKTFICLRNCDGVAVDGNAFFRCGHIHFSSRNLRTYNVWNVCGNGNGARKYNGTSSNA